MYIKLSKEEAHRVVGVASGSHPPHVLDQSAVTNLISRIKASQQQSELDGAYIEAAKMQDIIVSDGGVEVDDEAVVSHGDPDKGAYVMAWVWVSACDVKLPEPGEPCACANCEWRGTDNEADEIRDMHKRLTPGCEVPAGECPDCGALVYLVKKQGIPPGSQHREYKLFGVFDEHDEFMLSSLSESKDTAGQGTAAALGLTVPEYLNLAEQNGYTIRPVTVSVDLGSVPGGASAEGCCDKPDEEIVRDAVEHGITDIFYEIQKRIGVTDGGFADIWWTERNSGILTEMLNATFLNYIQSERAFSGADETDRQHLVRQLREEFRVTAFSQRLYKGAEYLAGVGYSSAAIRERTAGDLINDFARVVGEFLAIQPDDEGDIIFARSDLHKDLADRANYLVASANLET